MRTGFATVGLGLLIIAVAHALGAGGVPDGADDRSSEESLLKQGFRKADEESGEGAKIFCKSEVPTGSRIASRPLCGTAKQIAAMSGQTAWGMRGGYFVTFQTGARDHSSKRNGTNRDLCTRGTPDVAIISCSRVIADRAEPPDIRGMASRNRGSLFQSAGP